MQIIHQISDFFYTIFPELANASEEMIIQQLQEYYAYSIFKPKVTIDKGSVIVDIDVNNIIAQDFDYRRVVALCEKGMYKEAKPILKKLIDKNPTISEFHRINGQILSDEGDQEEAINCLIDALRWDAKNSYALWMMGNILAKFKDDMPTAMKYFEQALVVNPNDNKTIHTMGGAMLKQGKVAEAKKYFLQSIKIDDKYPNAHFGLGLVAEFENDLITAFNCIIQSIKVNEKQDDFYQHSIQQAFEVAKKHVVTDSGKRIFNEYRHKLEFVGEREIDIISDSDISTAAKIEFAEYYNTNKHIVKFKSTYPAVEHLIMHELVHLDFVIQARKENLNQVFYSTSKQKDDFIKSIEPTVSKFDKMGVSKDDVVKYCNSLFAGLNSQVYNAPIDLFIENYLYNDYPALRPYQFLSMYSLLQEGIKAVTDKEVISFVPKDIISKSKIYNIVNANQFRDLFGIDVIKNFKATPAELKQANGFYNEYLDYKDDKEPAEEYELVANWAADLKLDKNFDLESELQYHSRRSSVDDIISSIENDPFGFDEKDPVKERKMKKFIDSQANIGTNMAVILFMLDALNYFDGMPKSKIKEIAYEIAMQGSHGYSPDKDNYKLSTFPNQTFSGYKILAYYYVSFAIVLPEFLPQLELPYDAEYDIAKSMHSPKQQQ